MPSINFRVEDFFLSIAGANPRQQHLAVIWLAIARRLRGLCKVEIGVVENDVGGFAAEFDGTFEVGCWPDDELPTWSVW